jgi:hypothetical protein
MTYCVLELFRDAAAEDRIAVEGFDSVTALANFMLFAANDVHPGWRTCRADHHNDLREVLAMLETIEATARFLVGLGYDDAEIRRTLVKQFPGGNVEDAMSTAYADKARLDADVDAALEQEAAAARASELDLSKSIHGSDDAADGQPYDVVDAKNRRDDA